MSRVRQSYGVPLMRRANSMDGTAPEPMTMERLERKEFIVPETQPIILASLEPEPPEMPSGEAEAAPIEVPEGNEPTRPDPGMLGGGYAGDAGKILQEQRERNRRLLDEI